MTTSSLTTYFVLNGLINGEEGVFAVPAGGGDDPPQADGWYYIVDGMDDGVGPYVSEVAAMANGKTYVASLEEGS